MKQAFLRSHLARNASTRSHLAVQGSRTMHLLHLNRFHWPQRTISPTLAIRCQAVWMMMRVGFDSDQKDAAHAGIGEDVA